MKTTSFLRKALALFLLAVFSLATFTGCSPTNPTPPSGGDTGTGGLDLGDYYVTSLTITTPPDRTTYDIGEEFDYTGLRIKAEWNDGEVEEIGGYQCDSILPSGPLTADDTVITFTYYGKTVTQNITLNNTTIESLTIDTDYIQRSVLAGRTVDFSSLKVYAKYSDETTKEVTAYTLTDNGAEIINPNRHTVTQGNHSIVVSYAGKTQTFSIYGGEGYYVQGANMQDPATTTEKYYVEPAETMLDGKKEFAESDIVAGTLFSTKIGATVTFHVWADKAGKADVYLEGGSKRSDGEKITYSGNSHGYFFARTLDMEVDKTISIKMKGASDADYKDVPATSSTVFKGFDLAATDYPAESIKYNSVLTEYFATALIAENVDLAVGDNVIEITLLDTKATAGYRDAWNGSPSINIASLSIIYTDGTIEDEQPSQGDETAVESLSLDTTYIPNKVVTGQTVDLSYLKVTANYADGESETVNNYTITDNGVAVTTPFEYTITSGAHSFVVSYAGKTQAFSIMGGTGYYVQGGNIHDSASTTEKYYVETAETMVGGKKEFQQSSVVPTALSGLKVGATVTFHIWADKAGKASIYMDAGSQRSDAEKTDYTGNSQGYFYSRTLDMAIEKCMSVQIKNASASDYRDVALKTGSVLKGYDLSASAYAASGVKYNQVLTNYFFSTLIAEEVDLVVGDNVIEITVLESKTTMGYKDAWGSAPAFNIAGLSVIYAE